MSYIKYNVHLTEFQLTKLRAAAKKDEPFSLDINPNLKPNFELYLTQHQITKLQKGQTCCLNFSKNQIKKNGGFIFSIPAILAGIGAISGMASAAATVAKSVNAKKHENKTELEQMRHNKEMEKLLGKKSGLGAYLPRTKDNGKGIKTKKSFKSFRSLECQIWKLMLS